MNFLKCHCSKWMGHEELKAFWHLLWALLSREGTLLCNLSLLSISTKSTLPFTINWLSLLPSLRSISSPHLPTFPPHAIWKHPSIPSCIDYGTLALSGWTALIHQTHSTECHQHQSIFHFHNKEKREGKWKKKNRLRAGKSQQRKEGVGPWASHWILKSPFVNVCMNGY